MPQIAPAEILALTTSYADAVRELRDALDERERILAELKRQNITPNPTHGWRGHDNPGTIQSPWPTRHPMRPAGFGPAGRIGLRFGQGLCIVAVLPWPRHPCVGLGVIFWRFSSARMRSLSSSAS